MTQKLENIRSVNVAGMNYVEIHATENVNGRTRNIFLTIYDEDADTVRKALQENVNGRTHNKKR